MTAEANQLQQLELAEERRMAEEEARILNWKRWGPYLPERQWGTVREDYSPDGSVWTYFTHDHARSRTYRWGEDGLLGLTDRQCRLCFALALWNEKDSILKERLFGLSGVEGNHGEDVKECYYYLDSTPTHSYMKALYKYPQNAFPYAHLVEENRRRSREEPEYELSDTGIFDKNEYFDVFIEYAKAGPDDVYIRITAHNRASTPAPLHLLPTLWFRNTWAWGRAGEGYTIKPQLSLLDVNKILAIHPNLEPFTLVSSPVQYSIGPTPLFTDNETNRSRLFGEQNTTPYVKDAFHEYIVNQRLSAIDPGCTGTKAALHYKFDVPPFAAVTINLRLASGRDPHGVTLGEDFENVFTARRTEADEYYSKILSPMLSADERNVSRQAYAGLLWTKQFYYYSVREWLEGDPTQASPAPPRKKCRNSEWEHLYNRDIISVPDKWEYPWYAAWDLAFHMVAFAKVDPSFAKQQLLLLLREWYMHPNGQIPAYEFELSNVNPPVHAWACWRVYKMTSQQGQRDQSFLKRAFAKLLLNFTWWINRKDIQGKNLFAGGFLGLDNIGVFDRSAPLPKGGHLQQADATAWMAFYCGTMLAIALELAAFDEVYEDLASKFFEHFIAISDAINHLGGTGLWDQLDGFYYDQLQIDGHGIPLRARSLVGIIPMLAVEVLTDEQIGRLPGFRKRLEWFIAQRSDLAKNITHSHHNGLRLLAIPSRDKLERLLSYVLNEEEFLSPFGIRSLSKIHSKYPYSISIDNVEYRVDYSPGDSNTDFFGGNSNWRGPIWFPINVLLIEALERYHFFYGDSFKVHCPSGSGKSLTLLEVAQELTRRLSRLIVRNEDGVRACHGGEHRYTHDEHWQDLPLFYEYFHGDSGRGIGASHQTGWTALVGWCIERLKR
jgi:hypothetical protein